MGFNFPSTPTVGQLHPPTYTAGLPQYKWDGVTWIINGVPIDPKIVISDTPPASPVPGMMWWNASNGKLFVYYFDGDSSAWVQAAASLSDIDQSQLVKRAGDTMAGPLLVTEPTADAHAMPFRYYKRNRIINGGPQFSQDNNFTASTASGYWPCDMFTTAWSAPGLTAQLVSSISPGGSPYRLRLTTTTADAAVAAGDYATVFQCIEGLRWNDLRWGSASAKTVTLAFGCKGPAGTYCISFLIAAETRAYIAEYTILPGEANTDVRKYVTIPGDQAGAWVTDNSAALRIRWTFMCGTTFQQAAGAWGTVASAMGSANQFNLLGTINNVFELFDVDLYEGTAPRAYQLPDYITEYNLCRRYWQWLEIQVQGGYGIGGSNSFPNQLFPVPMRTTPVMTSRATPNLNNCTIAVGSQISNMSVRIDINHTATGLSYIQGGLWSLAARM